MYQGMGTQEQIKQTQSLVPLNLGPRGEGADVTQTMARIAPMYDNCDKGMKGKRRML